MQESSLGIITIGEGLVEFSSEKSLVCGETFNKFYGGDTLCTAVAALRCGSDVAYIAKVANDSFGEYLLDAWQLEGLDTSQVKITKGQNGVYFVSRNDPEGRSIYYRKKTAATMLSIEDINFDFIARAKLVYATGFVQSLSISCNEAVREVFAFAKKKGIQVAYCPNFSSNVWTPGEAREAFESVAEYIDILFLNVKADASAIFELESHDKIFARTSDLAINTTVIRENMQPTYLVSQGSFYEVSPRDEIEWVDATGAESAFNGAFLHYYLNGYDYLTCARYASLLANIQIQNVGAIRSIPNKETVEGLYRSIYG